VEGGGGRMEEGGSSVEGVERVEGKRLISL
jgi:hypothetical protein